jgi:hypothetical protein
MMRKACGAAVALALALVLGPGVNRAHAQCGTGCVSSSSCDGTGKSSCSTACGNTDGVPWCSCKDTQCGTQLRPVVMAGRHDARLVSNVSDPPLQAELLEDCHGNVVDVRFSTPGGAAAFPALRAIPIQRAPPGRLAARE